VVVTTRNDDHGGDPLKRLQALVNSFDARCALTGLSAELIVVEWNPAADKPRVSSVLRIPEPPQLHRSIHRSGAGAPPAVAVFRHAAAVPDDRQERTTDLARARPAVTVPTILQVTR
jgi:hypothetical protein